VLQVKFSADRAAVVLRKVGPDGRELELLLDEAEAVELLGSQHPVVREVKLHTTEAKRRRLAELEGGGARLRESLRT
jgi:hypothetical protein